MLNRYARAGLVGTIVVFLITSSVFSGLARRAGAFNGAGDYAPPIDFWARDTNGDGKYNWLWVNVSLDITVQDAFIFDLALNDATNSTTIASRSNTTYFLPGPSTVSLLVEGFVINVSGLNGPYLANLQIMNAARTIIATPSAPTPAYRATDFEQPPATVEAPFGDHGIDLDVPPDGAFNQLRLSFNVTFHEAGTFLLASLLLEIPSTDIVARSVLGVNATMGRSTFEMAFSGMEINASGSNGPYIEGVSVFALTGGSTMGMASLATNTSGIYLASDFQTRVPQTITGMVVDEFGAPVSGAIVRFFSYSDIYYNSTSTNAAGDYTMDMYDGDFFSYAVGGRGYVDDFANHTISGPGTFNYVLRNGWPERMTAMVTMSDPDNMQESMTIGMNSGSVDDRMVVDWLVGNRDGYASYEEEMVGFAMMGPGGGPTTTDTYQSMYLDDIFFYPDDYTHNVFAYDFTGTIYSSRPITVNIGAHFHSNSTIPSQMTHLYRIDGSYDSSIQETTITVNLPPGWIATSYDPVQNVSVTGIGTGTVVIDAGQNPGGLPNTFWVNVTMTDASFLRPVVSNAFAAPNPQEFMQPVLISGFVSGPNPITLVTAQVTAPVAGSIGNFTMGYNSSSHNYDCLLTSYPDLGTYQFTMWATDDQGKVGSATQIFEIQDTTLPIADAGPNQFVQNGTTVTFDGRGSTDNFGVSNWTWTFNDGTGPITLYGSTASHRFTVLGAYTVTLTAKDSSGNRDASTMKVTVLAPPTPNPPTNVMAIQILVTTVQVTWVAPTQNTNGSAITGPLTYWIYRASQPLGTYTILNPTAVSGTQYADATVVPGTYYYKVQAENQWGNESALSSPEASVTVTDRGSMNGSVQSEGQPLQGVLVEVLDSLGHVAASTNTTADGKFAIGNLAPGQYTIRASKGGYDSKETSATVTAFARTDVGVIVLSKTAISGTSELPWMWMVIIIVVIAIVLSLLAVLMKKRRKPAVQPGAMPPPPPPPP